jgi:hypothetical protein
MNKREQLLAIVVVALVVLFAGNYLYGSYARSMHAGDIELQNARTKLDAANKRLNEGKHAALQMRTWQERSLPSDYEKSLSLYRAWLLAKAKDAGLTVNDIKQTPTASNSTAYKAFGYQMTSNGSLTSLVSLLYEFYRSPQLHQITRLQVSRPPGGTQLQITLDVEAICLKGAVATDNLPAGDSKRLTLVNADAYKKSMAERDIVAAYTPPRPPAPPRVERKDTTPAPPKFDDAEFAIFSAAVGNGTGMQAWINVRTTGETLHLEAGDPVKVGALKGEIVSVEPRLLVYKSGNKKFQVPLGESLRKGKEIGPSGEAKSAAEAESPKS